jgi:heme ABC exporter ATP-binding subunit CcmA
MSPSTPPTAITATLTDVSHIYGDTAVLRHIHLQLKPARCSLLLGLNGAGKSTLLRILAGLLQPSFGSIETWGLPPAQARERIAYMSHAPMLYEELTAVENLNYFAALYAPHPCLSSARALQSVALDASLKKPVSTYSQGMRQRLSLARALLSRPALLLLDEPFSNMDADSAHAMLTLLAHERDSGTTIVLTTHQRALAEPLADELLLLAHGELIHETTREITRNTMSN